MAKVYIDINDEKTLKIIPMTKEELDSIINYSNKNHHIKVLKLESAMNQLYQRINEYSKSDKSLQDNQDKENDK